MIRRNFFADGRHSTLSFSTTLGILLVCSRMAFAAKPHAYMYAASMNSDEITTSNERPKPTFSGKITSPPSSLFVSKHLATLRRRQEICPHLFLIKRPYSGPNSRPVSGPQSATTASPFVNIPFGILSGGTKPSSTPPQGQASEALSIEQQCEWCGACRILQLISTNQSINHSKIAKTCSSASESESTRKNPSVGVVELGPTSTLSRRYAHARRLFEHLTPIIGDDAAEEPWVDLSYNVHCALVALDLHLKGASIGGGGVNANTSASEESDDSGSSQSTTAENSSRQSSGAQPSPSTSPALTKFLSSLTAQVSAKAMYKHAELLRSAREQQKAQSDGATTSQTYPTPSTLSSSSPSPSSLLQRTNEQMAEASFSSSEEGINSALSTPPQQESGGHTNTCTSTTTPTKHTYSSRSSEEGKVPKTDKEYVDGRNVEEGADSKTPFFVAEYRISNPKRQLITIDDLYNYVPHYKNIASAFPSIPYQKHVGTLPEIVKYFSSVAKRECLARYLTSETERELGHYVPRPALDGNHRFSQIDSSPIATASQYTLFRHPKCVFEGKRKRIVAPAPSTGTSVLKRGLGIENTSKKLEEGSDTNTNRSSENPLPDSLVVPAEEQQQQEQQRFSLEFIQSSLRATKFCAVVYGTAYEGHFFDSLLSVGRVRSFLEVYQSSHCSQLAAARRMASSDVGFMPDGTVWSVREQRFIGDDNHDKKTLSGRDLMSAKKSEGRNLNEATMSTNLGDESDVRGHNDDNDDGSPVPVVEIVDGNWTNVPWGITYVIAVDHQQKEITLAFRGTFADAGIIVDIHNGPISLFTREEEARLGLNRTVKATKGSEKDEEAEEAVLRASDSGQTQQQSSKVFSSSSPFSSFSSSTFSGPFGFVMGVRPGSPQTRKIDEELLRLSLIEYPHYRVVVTGHSLGAAYASNFVASRLLFGALAKEQGLYEPTSNASNDSSDVFFKEKNKQLGELMLTVRESVLRCEEQEAESGAAVDQQAVDSKNTKKADDFSNSNKDSSEFIKHEKRRPIFNKTLDDLFRSSMLKDVTDTLRSASAVQQGNEEYRGSIDACSDQGIKSIDFTDPFVVSGLYINGFITRNNNNNNNYNVDESGTTCETSLPIHRSTLEDRLTVCSLAPPASANMAWRQALDHFFPKLDLRSFVHDTDVVTRLQIASLRIMQETINNSEVIPNVLQRALYNLKSSLVPPIAKTISPIASLLSKQLSSVSSCDKKDAKKDNDDHDGHYSTSTTSDYVAAVNDADSEVDEVISSEHIVYKNIHYHLEKELGDIKKLLEAAPRRDHQLQKSPQEEGFVSNAGSVDVGDEKAKCKTEHFSSTSATNTTESRETSSTGGAVENFAPKALPYPLSSLLVARCPTEQMQNLEDLRTCFTFIEKERQRSSTGGNEQSDAKFISEKGKGEKQPLANSTETTDPSCSSSTPSPSTDAAVAGGGDPSSLLEPIPRHDSIGNFWVPLGKIYLLGRAGQEHMTAPRLMATHLTEEEKKKTREAAQKAYSSSDFLCEMEQAAIADLFAPKIVSFSDENDTCSDDGQSVTSNFKEVHREEESSAERTTKGDGENTQSAEVCELYDIPDASFDIATAFNSQRRAATMAMIADPLVPSLSIPIIDTRSAQNHFLFRYGRALLDLAVSSEESDKHNSK